MKFKINKFEFKTVLFLGKATPSMYPNENVTFYFIDNDLGLLTFDLVIFTKNIGRRLVKILNNEIIERAYVDFSLENSIIIELNFHETKIKLPKMKLEYRNLLELKYVPFRNDFEFMEFITYEF